MNHIPHAGHRTATPGAASHRTCGAVPELLKPEAEARLHWGVRLRATLTVIRQNLAHARLRLLLVGSLSALLWLVLCRLFFDGFVFIREAIPFSDLQEDLVRYVLGAFFLTLAVMLIFSSAIIMYGALFRGSDTAHLLTLPTRPERIFWMKYQETVFLSSWGFLFLGTPILVAYGQASQASWPYYVMMLPLMLAFVYIPAAIGAMLTLLVARFIARLRTILIGACVIAVFAGFVLLIRWIGDMQDGNLITVHWLNDTLNRLRLTQLRFLPSWWLTSGLLSYAHGQPSDGTMFFVLLTCNTLFLNQMVAWLAARLYRPLYQTVAGRRGKRRIRGKGFLRGALIDWFPLVPQHTRLLMAKDLKIFQRDPVQWLQSLIFVGLLVFYFLNMQRFYYERAYAQWVNMVSMLNLTVIGLLLSTFTTRFLFPLVSLEGPRFWVLGQLPIPRSSIVSSKLVYGIGVLLVPTAILVGLSDVMLRVDGYVMLSHQLTAALMCVGLSGIAVGLGARFPNFRENAPSRIAAGFGGTLNLIVSTFYNVLILALAALPSHLQFLSRGTGPVPVLGFRVTLDRWLEIWNWTGPPAAVMVCIAATYIPLSMGLKHFRNVEF